MTKLLMMMISGGDAPLVVFPWRTSSFSGGCFSCRKLDPKLLLSTGIVKSFHSYSIANTRRLENYRTKGLMVRASADSNDNPTPVAPLRFESPTGQLLEQILQTHPHLLPVAIDQHLENLQADRDSQKEEAPPPGQDLLYRESGVQVQDGMKSVGSIQQVLHCGRISEVKEKDRRKTLEEIIYCVVVQKFMDNNISMIPSVSVSSDPTGMVGFWPNQEQKLESVHSPESFEMILSHLSLVLGERTVGPLDNSVKMSKLKLGKLYAASIMYGYFLKRVDQRFQLERSMKTLPAGFEEEQAIYREPIPESPFWDPDSLIMIQPDDDFGDAEGGPLDTRDSKAYKLRSYVMYLDADTLQRYATIRSKEAISLIEKQTQALFGRPDIRITQDGSIDTSNDEVIEITFSGLTLLVLEAVTFGSFLWDAEGYVESRYPFVKS